MKYRRVHRDVCPNGRSAWVRALTHLQRMRKFTQLLFSYKGRINRKTYLLYHICGLGGYFLVAYAFMAFFSPERETLHPELQYLLYVVQVLLGFLGVLLLYGTIPTSVKRLHDLNQSGWWLLLIGIVIILLKLIFVPRTKNIVEAFDVVFWLFALDMLVPFITFVFLCCLPGTKDKNRYGEMPGGVET